MHSNLVVPRVFDVERRDCEAGRCLSAVPTESYAYLQGSSALRRGEGKRAAAARKETHARWRTTAVTGRTDLRLLRLLLRLLEEGVAASRDRHISVVQGDDRARPKFHKHATCTVEITWWLFENLLHRVHA